MCSRQVPVTLRGVAGPLHAVLLILLMAATAVAVARASRMPTGVRTGLSLLAGLTYLFLVGSLRHMCPLGQPLTQWLIPGVCMTVSLLCIGATALRRTLAGAAMVLGVALTWNFIDVVHGPDFVGTNDARLVGPTHREWHTWISGLYRRDLPPPDASRGTGPGRDRDPAD